MRNNFIKIFLLSILTTIMISCNNEKDIQTYDFSGTWKVISFVDLEASTKILKAENNTWSQFNNGDNTISFTKLDSTNGHVSGRNVTNSFSGEFTTDSIGKISISKLIWTEVNEPEWGILFHTISKAELYEIKNNILTIFYNEKKNFITLERIGN